MLELYVLSGYSYSKKSRVAFVMSEKPDDAYFERVCNECCNATISLHRTMAKGSTIPEIYESFPELKDSIITSSTRNFIRLVQDNLAILNVDVVKYIIAKCRGKKLNHITIDAIAQKSYEIYFAQTGRCLYADLGKDNTLYYLWHADTLFPIETTRHRITTAEDGFNKLEAIDRAIGIYVN